MTGLDSILKVHTQISVFMILIHQIDNIKYFQKLTCFGSEYVSIMNVIYIEFFVYVQIIWK